MNATATSRAVMCTRCGTPTGEYTDDGNTSQLGACCRNLPGLFEYDRDTGLYSRSADSGDDDRDDRDDRDDDRELDERPRCESCEGTRFDVVEYREVRQTVDGAENDELADATLWMGHGITETDRIEVHCHSCGSQWHGTYDWS